MDAPDPAVAPPPEEVKRTNLSSQQRRDIVATLLLTVEPGDADMKLARGSIKSCSDTYDVHRRTIMRIWERALSNYRNPNIGAFISSPQMKGRSGRPTKWVRDDVREAVKALPLHLRRTFRSMATALEIPKTTLHRMKEDKMDMVIMPCSIAVKPLLTEVHKVQPLMD